MSQVYSTEPGTTGRVILETSHGPIDVALWCKECPTTTRAFLQLCTDGYYDSMVFHRIMENFLIQAGQVRRGGEGTVANGRDDGKEMEGYLRERCSAAGATAAEDEAQSSRRKLEVSPRIRFNHRGQVALALPLDEAEDDVGGLRNQFFITLDETPFLDGRHVIFGTVTGPTIFNALRIGKVEADEETSRPVDMEVSPPLIKSVRVDHHPFEDMVPTDDTRVPWKRRAIEGGAGEGKAGAASGGGESEVKKRRKKRKGKRDLNVLSFGDEEREMMMGDNDGGGGGGGGMRSSHDVVSHESAFLLSSVDEGVRKAAASDDKRKKAKKSRRRDGNGAEECDDGRNFRPEAPETSSSLQSDGAVANGNTTLAKESQKNGDGAAEKRGTNGDCSTSERSKEPQSAASKTSSREPARAKERPVDRQTKTKHGTEKGMSELEARRAKYLRRGASGAAMKGADKSRREEDTLAKLSAFRSKVLQSKGKSDAVGGDSNDRKVVTDNSLATRMAKRSAQAEEELKESKAADLGPTYRGQVLENDDADDDGGASAASWLGTKFKCRKHIDQASKEGSAEAAAGGDGRDMDDYVVIDGKKGKEGGSGRRHGHRHRHQHGHRGKAERWSGHHGWDDANKRGGRDKHHRP